MFHKEDPKTWRTVETGRFPVLGVYPVGVIPAEILSDKPEHLRMMFTSLGNPVRSYPDSKAMEEALKHLELLVSIDISMTETAKLADYVLPGKTSYESYDFNVFPLSYPEIVCQLKHPALGQVGERKEDSEIWTGLAEAMGLLPKLPERLYRAAERAVHTSDRIPYFMRQPQSMISLSSGVSPARRSVMSETPLSVMTFAARRSVPSLTAFRMSGT